MAQEHGIHGQFTYFQDADVPFDKSTVKKTICIVNAFSKKFVFYYYSNANAKMVYFIIFLLGKQADAQKFYYEFKIVCPNNENKNVGILKLIDTTLNMFFSNIFIFYHFAAKIFRNMRL